MHLSLALKVGESKTVVIAVEDSAAKAVATRRTSSRGSWSILMGADTDRVILTDGEWGHLITLRDTSTILPDPKAEQPAKGWFVTPIHAVYIPAESRSF